MEKRMHKAISVNCVLVGKLDKKAVEGFQSVEVQDNFVYKGRVIQRPDCPVYVDSYALELGDVVIFAKYSPDTHEIDGDKFVKVSDILAVCSNDEVD